MRLLQTLHSKKSDAAVLPLNFKSPPKAWSLDYYFNKSEPLRNRVIWE
jgi:hypothetical protein